jgi:hypothetical protein
MESWRKTEPLKPLWKLLKIWPLLLTFKVRNGLMGSMDSQGSRSAIL